MVDKDVGRPGVSALSPASMHLHCALFLLLYGPAEIFFLELLELLLREQRLWLLGLLGFLGRSVQFIPGLSPCIVVEDLFDTENKEYI